MEMKQILLFLFIDTIKGLFIFIIYLLFSVVVNKNKCHFYGVVKFFPPILMFQNKSRRCEESISNNLSEK